MSENNVNKGVDIAPLLKFKDLARKDPSKADRHPMLVAEWVGGDQSRVKFGDIETYLGGEGNLNPMQMFLACLAACDVDLIAMHASFMGIKIKSLSIEASGHFNVQSYLGLENAPGSGYDTISYTVRLSAPDITEEQKVYLIDRCEKSSPVGDSMSRRIPLKLDFITA